MNREKLSNLNCKNVWIFVEIFVNIKSLFVVRKKSDIRLQWDPSHAPDGTAIKERRAIQIGMRCVLTFCGGSCEKNS
jgi:hypothetical protein